LIPGTCFKILGNLLESSPQTRKLIDEPAFLVALDAILGENKALKDYALKFIFQFFNYHSNAVCARIINKNPDLLDFLLCLLQPETKDMAETVLETIELLLRLGEGMRNSDSGYNPVLQTIICLESVDNLYQISNITPNRNALEIQSRILNFYLHSH